MKPNSKNETIFFIYFLSEKKRIVLKLKTKIPISFSKYAKKKTT